MRGSVIKKERKSHIGRIRAGYFCVVADDLEALGRSANSRCVPLALHTIRLSKRTKP